MNTLVLSVNQFKRRKTLNTKGKKYSIFPKNTWQFTVNNQERFVEIYAQLRHEATKKVLCYYNTKIKLKTYLH